MKIVVLDLEKIILEYKILWKFKRVVLKKIQSCDMIYFKGNKIPERFFSILMKHISSEKIIVIDSINFLKIVQKNPFFLIINHDFDISYLKMKNLVYHKNCREVFVDYSGKFIKRLYFDLPICPIISNIYQDRSQYSYRHIHEVKKLYEYQKKLKYSILDIDKNIKSLNQLISKDPFVFENTIIKENKTYNIIMGIMGDIIWNKSYAHTIKYHLKNISNKQCSKCIHQEDCSDMFLGVFIKNNQCVNFSKKFFTFS